MAKNNNNGKWKKLKETDEEDIQTYIWCQMLINSVGICSVEQMESQLVLPLIEEKKKDGEAWIYQDAGFVAIFGVETITYKEKYRIVSIMTYPITKESFPEALEIIAERILDHMQTRSVTYMEASAYILENWETSIYYNIGFATPQDFVDFVHNTFQNLDGYKLTYILNDSDPQEKYLEIYLQE